MKLLTKSKFLQGLDSQALLWRSVHQPQTIPAPEEFQQQIFDTGTEVGKTAQLYFNEGIDLSDLDFYENLEKTQTALTKRKPIFEAGFLVDRLHVRVDILLPAGEDEWEIVEVKSSTKLKATHIHDIAFQKFVLESWGLKIKTSKLMLINNQYMREGELSILQLFYFINVDEEVSNFLLKVPQLIQQMIEVLDLPQCPEYKIEDYRKGAYRNVFEDEFLAKLPKGSIFELYNSKKKLELWLSGVKSIAKLPIGKKTPVKHAIQKEVAESGTPHIDHNKITEFISGLSYPIYHLDFETFNPVLPPFDGTCAYMQIPFQYSLHIEYEDGAIEHKEYLHTESTDPRKPLFEQLKKDLGSKGTILAFFETFEKKRVEEWAKFATEYADWFADFEERLQDLLTPFKQFYYYHPEQRGTCSIKKVLPVMSDLSYEGMPIADGGAALSAYKKYFYKQTPHPDKEQLIQDMLAYCKQDTWAMVLILKRLRALVLQ